MSWSRDAKFIAARRDAQGLGVQRPTLWDVARKSEITPEWLKAFRYASFSAGTDELVTADEKGRISVWDTKDLGNSDGGSPKVPPFGEGFWLAAISPDGDGLPRSRAITTSRSGSAKDRTSAPLGI